MSDDASETLAGRFLGCQILLTGLIARVANAQPDPVAFLTDFRDEIKTVVAGIDIAGVADSRAIRHTAQQTVDELFGLMKPPSVDEP